MASDGSVASCFMVCKRRRSNPSPIKLLILRLTDSNPMRTLKYVLSVSKDISSSLYSVERERLQARIGALETVLGQRA